MPNFYNIIRAKKFSTAADTALEIAPYNSATPNFAIDAGGKLKWGSGSATADTTLYRSLLATNTFLKMTAIGLPAKLRKTFIKLIMDDTIGSFFYKISEDFD